MRKFITRFEGEEMKLNLYKIDSYFEKTAKDEISEKDYNLLGSEYVEGVKYELFINQKNRNSIKWLESMK